MRKRGDEVVDVGWTYIVSMCNATTTLVVKNSTVAASLVYLLLGDFLVGSCGAQKDVESHSSGVQGLE